MSIWNRGRQIKRLWVICLIIAAIACLGLGYGVFSQNFNFSGPVSTGSFDVVFDSFTAPPNGPHQTSFSASPSTTDGTHNYDITLSNLYPGCNATFTFNLKDTGTVPAKINHIYIKQGANIIATDPTGAVSLALGADTSNDISVTISGISAGLAIPANNIDVQGTLQIQTSSGATPSASGTFTIEIDTIQNP
jgi:hypothetical protein